MLPLLDIAIPNNGFPINPASMDQIRRNHCEPWMYNIGHNRLTWGFYLLKTGATGRLQWHYRCGLQGTCDPNNWLTSSTYAVSDTAPDALFPTQDWENIRAGVDDVRYVRTMESLTAQARKSDRPAARAAVTRAQQRLDWIMQRIDPDLSHYSGDVGFWDPAAFDKLRRQIAQEILSLQEALQ
jgi:hypothetical protein